MSTGKQDPALAKAESAAPRRRAVKWHLVYYLLAAFDLLAIAGSLYLNHQVMGIFRSSVEVNQQWANKLGDLSEIGAAAGAVNAPGNDIFDSLDVDKELARQAAALVVFERRLTDFGVVVDRVPVARDKANLRAGIVRIETAMGEMRAEAARIFADFRKNKAASAGRRMATMDRKFAVLTATIADTAKIVRDVQRSQFQDQVSAAAFLGWFEYAFGVLIVLMVGAVMIYGHRIGAEFKRHEAARAAHTTELERNAVVLEDMSSRLTRSLAESETGNRAKTAFLTTMSHELRTPLNAIIGFAEIIQSGSSHASVKHAEYAADIENSGRHLLSLINQILDLARIDSGKMSFTPSSFDLGALVDECARSLRLQAENGGTALTVTRAASPLIVRADELAIRQIVLNLVSNAMKFAPEGHVDVEVSCAGDVAEITVADTGCGIPPESLERIFLPFEQASNPLTRQHGGTGLGLPIVAKLAEAHGGTCDVTSTVGKGSRFRVRLPILAGKERLVLNEGSEKLAAAG